MSSRSTEICRTKPDGIVYARSTSSPEQTRLLAEDATTAYCTSFFGHTADGRPDVLTGRAGAHNVPEQSVGLSLIDLSPGHEGKIIWRLLSDSEADGTPMPTPGSSTAGLTWQALYTLQRDKNYAYWFGLNPPPRKRTW